MRGSAVGDAVLVDVVFVFSTRLYVCTSICYWSEQKAFSTTKTLETTILHTHHTARASFELHTAVDLNAVNTELGLDYGMEPTIAFCGACLPTRLTHGLSTCSLLRASPDLPAIPPWASFSSVDASRVAVLYWDAVPYHTSSGGTDSYVEASVVDTTYRTCDVCDGHFHDVFLSSLAFASSPPSV